MSCPGAPWVGVGATASAFSMNNLFGPHVDVFVERYGTRERYRMHSIDTSFETAEGDLAALVEICNEPLTRRFLFRDRLRGRRYGEQDALDFLAWARRGWELGERMAFLLRDPDGCIGACVDVRERNESGSGYIGYWAGAHHRGVITNAVDCLAGLARDAGYLKFMALVEPENVRSAAVLNRTGFSLQGLQEQPVTFLDKPVGNTIRFLRYERAL